MTLDTLQLAKDLQAASFTPQQAETLTRVLREREEQSGLVTKADLAVVKADLELAIAKLKAELLGWTIGLLVAQGGIIIAAIKFLPSG